ncbi:regulator of G-protein signaling 17-like isoform X2 [Ptychodera flava]|uniref:regulator of G-protein signaling 17-like isoform X2 n=1 Tax=Ptychodera flava TaxID=63121 RepID=UPI003969D9BA
MGRFSRQFYLWLSSCTGLCQTKCCAVSYGKLEMQMSTLSNVPGNSGSKMKKDRAVTQNTPPPSPAAPDKNKSKACCFCWCCCCSCSCLAVRDRPNENEKQKGDTKLELLGKDTEKPSIEEIKSWAESFDKLMKSPYGRDTFRDFLKLEYSEENLLFWIACEDLRQYTDQETVEEKSRLIYEDYISILSPKEVSLDSRVREVINRNMVDPTPHTFDDAQQQIYILMHRDSYPRFINSQTYKRLLCKG